MLIRVVVLGEGDDDDDDDDDEDYDYDDDCKKYVGSAVAFLFFITGMPQCMDAHGNQLRSSTLTVLPENSGTNNTHTTIPWKAIQIATMFVT